SQLAVIRSKVVSPPVDAMCFIDYEVGGSGAANLLNLGGTDHPRVESFWGAEQELDRAGPHQLVPNLLFLRPQIAVDKRSGNLPSLEISDLLIHQCLQR